MKTLTKDMQAAITPEMALNLLKEGNKRSFRKGLPESRLMDGIRQAHFCVLDFANP
ncbi:hypothetical protein [Methylocucumis oryzae]|uniref:hypothetical protein n=1 Tax=Methylocucumis oryzae TaxID=1632867 RepID=UPI0019553884|nr:hypothetical protein [Methylocucumis oryzae]